jgi:TRAP-type C4-dicarboxylate transport system permease small subunit
MKYFTIIILLLLSVIPIAVFAASQNCGDKLCNPLRYDSIEQLLPKLLDIVAQVGLVICTFFIVYAGFKYVTANGDPGKITTAHNILLWSVIGTAVLLGAKVLASILSNTVNQIIK